MGQLLSYCITYSTNSNLGSGRRRRGDESTKDLGSRRVEANVGTSTSCGRCETVVGKGGTKGFIDLKDNITLTESSTSSLSTSLFASVVDSNTGTDTETETVRKIGSIRLIGGFSGSIDNANAGSTGSDSVSTTTSTSGQSLHKAERRGLGGFRDGNDDDVTSVLGLLLFVRFDDNRGRGRGARGSSGGGNGGREGRTEYSVSSSLTTSSSNRGGKTSAGVSTFIKKSELRGRSGVTTASTGGSGGTELGSGETTGGSDGATVTEGVSGSGGKSGTGDANVDVSTSCRGALTTCQYDASELEVSGSLETGGSL
jgi:hypothetical protein